MVGLLALIFLALTATATAQQCHIQGQCSGIIVSSSLTSTYNDCLDRCKSNPNCYWHTHFDNDDTCIEFYNCPVLDTTVPDCRSGHVECSHQQPLCNAQGFCNGQFIGHAIVQSVEECLRVCTSYEECQWYSYHPDTRQCILTEDCIIFDDSCTICLAGERACSAITTTSTTTTTTRHFETTPNPDTVTSNPLGTCRCDGELWVSEGCTHGFYCNSSVPGLGGVYLSCDYLNGESLFVDPTNHRWKCSKEAPCPGYPVDGVGCETPACDTYATNHLGTCGCDGQIFISQDCSHGFLCQSGDNPIYDGCLLECPDANQILIPDFASDKGWACVDNTDGHYVCPGRANLECPQNALVPPFDSSMCLCSDSHLMVSEDCKDAFYCNSRVSGGGRNHHCGMDEIIDVDFISWGFRCVRDNGNCPGMGGYRLGCKA